MTSPPPVTFNLNLNGTQIIDSPGYPNEYYPNGANVVWIFTSDETGAYRITFISFALESYYDFLYIGDGSESSPESIRYELSGNQNTPIIIASSDMWLRFQSDSSVTRAGFRLAVTLIGKDVYINPVMSYTTRQA